jgi:hypothetical protein
MLLPALLPCVRSGALALLPRALTSAAAWPHGTGAAPAAASPPAPRLQLSPARRCFSTSAVSCAAADARKSPAGCGFHTCRPAWGGGGQAQTQAPGAADAAADTASAPPESVVAPLAKTASPPPAQGGQQQGEALYSLRQVRGWRRPGARCVPHARTPRPRP